MIYRFVALGSLEELVYKKQVTKLSISKRVVDQHQIDRHDYNDIHDLSGYYSTERINPLDHDSVHHVIPDDPFLKKQLEKPDNLIYKYHVHDTLLENKTEESLSKIDRKRAWTEYESDIEKKIHKDKMEEQKIQRSKKF